MCHFPMFNGDSRTVQRVPLIFPIWQDKIEVHVRIMNGPWPGKSVARNAAAVDGFIPFNGDLMVIYW